MKAWLKQKPLIIAGLVLLVTVAAYANLRALWRGDSVATGASLDAPVIATRTQAPAQTPGDKTPAATDVEDSVAQSDVRFSRIREERTTSRNALIAQLDELIMRTGTEKSVRKQAEKDRVALLKWMDAEAAIEDVLKAGGYHNALATVRDGSANIVLQVATLEQEAALRVIEVAARESGLPAKEIKIIIAK